MLRLSVVWVALCLAALLSACASRPPATGVTDKAVGPWAGRLSLRVNAEPGNSFSSAFELQGDAQTGALSLYAPLGATIAQLSWSPGKADLRANGTERSFDSLGALVRAATGTDLPVGSIFQWLAGHAADADGWRAELGDISRGRLVARRAHPEPAVELRLVLD